MVRMLLRRRGIPTQRRTVVDKIREYDATVRSNTASVTF